MSEMINWLVGVFFFAITPLFIYSQSVDKCIDYEGKLINCLDSAGNRVGLWLEFDIDSVKYKAILYSTSGEVEDTKFFRKTGSEIKDCTMNLSPILVKKLRERIRFYFDWGNVVPRDGQGVVLLSLLINCDGSIDEVRILRGIHHSLNEEVMRAAKLLEDNLIFICPQECRTSLLVVFPIYF